jgi:hypothetical protein
MSGLTKRLTRWMDAGLMTADQAARITEFESTRRKGGFGRGLTGAAIFAILLGVLSIVASNWNDIPGNVKIAVHIILNAGVAFVLFKNIHRDMWREGAVLALFGLTLTLLALIGQVFQLGDGTYGGLLSIWLIATLPLLAFFGRGKMTAIPWVFALVVTVWTVLVENIEILPDPWKASFGVAASALIPLALMGDGNIPWVQKNRPAWSSVFIWTGLALLAITASSVTFIWYDNARAGDMYPAYTLPVFALGLIGIFVHAAWFKFYRGLEELKSGAIFSAVSLIVMMLPFALPGVESGILSAVVFIGYWVFIGWTAQQMGWPRLISLSITLIAIRIFAVYVEVFGTLFDTGVGLIIGGAVMLGLIALARKLNRRLTKGNAHG